MDQLPKTEGIKRQCPVCAYIGETKIRPRFSEMCSVNGGPWFPIHIEYYMECSECKHQWLIEALINVHNVIMEN